MSTLSNKAIGARIKIARLEAGITQEELGEKIGVTSVMISRYEGGKTSPMRQLDQISQVLNKPTDFFFGDSNKDSLYEDVRELVRLLKEKTDSNNWPFRPSVPVLKAADLSQIRGGNLQAIRNLEEKERTDCTSSVVKADPESFAIKIDSSFSKSSFPVSTTLIVSPALSAKDNSIVLRSGKSGLVVGKRSTTRGKMIGVVVEIRIEG
jgi:transcriptional regulator with XRE-family HTH domain